MFFTRALSKTLEKIKASVGIQPNNSIEKETLEEMLIEADIEYELIESLLEKFGRYITKEELEQKLLPLFATTQSREITSKPFVDLIIGVNGAGKTTTIAKLAHRYQQQNKTVLFAAGDTFRAAAIEQLTLWAEKLRIGIVKTQKGHDPSAVAFDAISSAIAKKIDHVIVDTAGRLQTQTNLNHELKKIVATCSKALNNQPYRKLLILDGTQGNAAIAQAMAFHTMVQIDGIIVTKLDGSAKGGAIFSIAHKLKIPILYIGIGEQQEDLLDFDPRLFVHELLEAFFGNTEV